MLLELHVQNFALVSDLRVETGEGFSVLTGETGTGKSIIVDAVSAALGERVGSEVVRTGQPKCVVQTTFDVTDCPQAAEAAAANGFEPEDGLLILSREISRDSRSVFRVNGRTATASAVKEISAHLVDIHGQHEHQSLLAASAHLDTFDSWCGAEVEQLRQDARQTYDDYRGASAELEELETGERERARLLDLYRFQLQEILDAKLQPNEEEELSSQRNLLANAEKLRQHGVEAVEALCGDAGAVETLGAALISLERVADLDPGAAGALEPVQTALAIAQDCAADLRKYMEKLDADPDLLEQVQERLDLIRTLKKKYGAAPADTASDDSVEDILLYGDDLKAKIDLLDHAQERHDDLAGRISELSGRLTGICEKLRKLRIAAKPRFEKLIEAELADLGMEKCRFEVSIEPTEPGPTGGDKLEFLISPNPGEPVKPLVKIASGGELSRIMLALRTITTSADVPTVIFDEIDAGIGGLTAQTLGDKIAALSAKKQVLCVTHLPQVASKAARHFCVKKHVVDGSSVVEMSELEGEARVAEIARMLGGTQKSEAAVLHAREMLLLAHQRNS